MYSSASCTYLRQKRLCGRVIQWHRSTKDKRHLDVEFHSEKAPEKTEIPKIENQKVRIEVSQNETNAIPTWNDIRALRETKEAMFEPVNPLVQTDKDIAETTSSLRKDRYCSTSLFALDKVNHIAERIVYSEKSHAVYGLTGGDVHCTEVLERIEDEERFSKGNKNKNNIICCTIATQLCTTAGLLVSLSTQLKVPFEDLRCFSFTESPLFSVTQKIYIFVSETETKYVLHRLKQLSSELLRLPSSVSLTSVSVHNALMKPGVKEIPAHYKITKTSLDPTEGSFIILNFEVEKLTGILNEVDDIAKYYSLQHFQWKVVLRDVKADEQTIDNVLSMRDYGALNLLPMAYCNSDDGRGWIRTAAALSKGNFRQACSGTLKTLSQIDPTFRETLKRVEVLSSQAKSQTAPWYNSVESSEGDLETPPIISESDFESALQELDSPLEWGGDLLFATLADMQIGHYQGAYENIPPLIRSRIENSLRDYIWNTMACERLFRYGPSPVVGDIVVNNVGGYQIIKTQDECSVFSPRQVVLPRPPLYSGHDWQKGLLFPAHDISQAAYEILMKKLELVPERLYKMQPKPNPNTCYRTVFMKSSNFDFHIESGDFGSKIPVGEISSFAMRDGVQNTQTLPPTLYNDIWSCSSCGTHNHPHVTRCSSCASNRIDLTDHNLVNLTEPTANITLSMTTLPNTSLEVFLSEAFSLHNWQAYDDGGSKLISKLASCVQI